MYPCYIVLICNSITSILDPLHVGNQAVIATLPLKQTLDKSSSLQSDFAESKKLTVCRPTAMTLCRKNAYWLKCQLKQERERQRSSAERGRRTKK